MSQLAAWCNSCVCVVWGLAWAHTGIYQEQEELHARQTEPEDPALVATVPSLALSDMPTAARLIPRQVEVATERQLTVLRHEQPTQGIVHFGAGFDISGLKQVRHDAVVPTLLLLLLNSLCVRGCAWVC